MEDPRDTAISGLANRIQEAVALSGKSESAVAVAAGLERVQLGMTRARLKKNPSAGVDVRIVVGLARVTGVTIDWLLTGRGEARGQDLSPTDRAHQAALLLGYSADVIATGLAAAAPNEDARAILRRVAVAELAPPVAANVVVSALTVMKNAPEGGHDADLAKLDKDKRKPKAGG